MPHSKHLSPIEEIIADAKAGKMCILVDDEARENEGDLVIPAQMADANAINFMAKHGRGLICLTLTRDRVSQLGLPLMSRHNTHRRQTAFTVSIEAKEGVTTGISAADRAQTVAVAIDPSKGASDICTPGHIFPLVAREGGVLVRAGHTEAAVDIAKLAGLNPSGVICEIMNDDGSMARLPDLVKFASEHNIKIATIADLISYRLRYEKLVTRVAEAPFKSRFGDFHMIVYGTQPDYTEHVALVKGDISGNKPVLVRMHALDILHDALGGTHNQRGGMLESSMRMIEKAGSGVIVLICKTRKTSLSEQARQLSGEKPSKDLGLRNYGIGAQILLDLGVKEMVLASNSKHMVVGLEGYGLTIRDYQPIPLLS